MTTLLLLLLPFAWGVYVYRYYVLERCRVVEKTEEPCGGMSDPPHRMCSMVTLDCPNRDWWNRDGTLRVFGEGSSILKFRMRFNEIWWVCVDCIQDFIMYHLSNGHDKISNGHRLYIDGESIQLGPKYEIRESGAP